MDGSSSAGGAGQAVPNDTSQAGDSHPTVSLRVVTATCLSLLILCTLLGNSLVCAAVLRFTHLRSKVTNLFVVSLAVSDLLVAVLVMPWRAATDVLGFWPFGAFCDLWVAFDIMCCTASILNLCLVSVERYCAIAGPFRHHGTVTPRVASVAIGVAWLLSLLISFIPVQLRWHKDVAQGLNGSVEEGGCDSSLGRTYAISSSLVSFYIPVAIMLGTYGRLFRIARRQLRAVASAERPPGHPGGDSPRETSPKNSFRKETKVLQTLSIIVGVFVCCWLPFFVLNCLVPFCHPEPRAPGALPCVGGTVLGIFTWLGWANSALNPIIYAFNAEFRRAFASLLGWGRLCPGGAVQTVTFSNELVSFQPDTAECGAVGTPSCPQTLPHAGAVETLSPPQPLPHAGVVETLSPPQPLPQAVLQLETHQGSSDEVSPGSSPPPQPSPECGTPVSLGKVPPLGSSAFH